MDINQNAYVPYEEKGGELFGQHTTDGLDQVAVPSGTAAMHQLLRHLTWVLTRQRARVTSSAMILRT